MIEFINSLAIDGKLVLFIVACVALLYGAWLARDDDDLI